MTSDLTLSQSIVRAVCERDERPDPDHEDTLLVTADDLETIIDNHFERWGSTTFNVSLADFQSRAEAARIADAVLGWLVKYDLAEAGNEYRAADVIAIMDDLAPSPSPKLEGWTKVPADLPQALLRSINRDNQVLAYENGRYFNAWFEFEASEGGWFWTDDADSEPNPSHYRALPAEPGATTEGQP